MTGVSRRLRKSPTSAISGDDHEVVIPDLVSEQRERRVSGIHAVVLASRSGGNAPSLQQNVRC